jgi:peptidoglycan/xylan/chitin deacetylase (PgdA/CDA1 family)
MNQTGRNDIARQIRFAILGVVATISLLLPGPVSAADAPNSCAAAAASAQNTWLYNTIASSTDVDWFRFDKTYSGYAQVTLGRLSRDYDLYLYGGSSCTSAIASSRRSGTAYDEIYRNLAAGRYYVRVVGYAGASSGTNYALRFRPLSEAVQVLSASSWTDSANYLHVAGEVINNTSTHRRWVEITATLRNSAGTAIGTAVGYSDVAVMRARTRSPFEIVTRKPATYSRVSLAVVARATSGPPIANLGVTAAAPSTDGTGAVHYTGSLRNGNTFGVTLARTHVTLYDTYGGVRGIGWGFAGGTAAAGASPSTIAAGAGKTFDVVASSTTASPNRVVYQGQATTTGCNSSPRYSTAGQENFAGVPTINRTTATNRVALTFDMGGRMDPAVAILNRLVAYRVCATIFPTGAISQTAQGQAALAIVRAHPELFELGNHTENHCDLVRGEGGAPGAAEASFCNTLAPSPTEAQVKKELTDGEAAIAAVVGRSTKPFWRAPYGSYNATVLRWAAEVGYTKHFRWDVDTIDWKPISQGGPTAASMTLKVVNNARSGTVVLMHLGGYETLDALPSMIDGLRSRGFALTTLSDMAQ